MDITRAPQDPQALSTDDLTLLTAVLTALDRATDFFATDLTRLAITGYDETALRDLVARLNALVPTLAPSATYRLVRTFDTQNSSYANGYRLAEWVNTLVERMTQYNQGIVDANRDYEARIQTPLPGSEDPS